MSYNRFDTSEYVIYSKTGKCLGRQKNLPVTKCDELKPSAGCEFTDMGIPISTIPDDLMALAAIAVSITDRRVVFSDCTEVEALEGAANALTPETRKLIEEWKARQ